MKTALVVFLLGAAALFTLHVSAGYPHGSHEDRMTRHKSDDIGARILSHLGEAVRQLDLSDTQKENIHAIFQESKADLRANHEAAKAGVAELHTILTADILDEDALADAARLEGDLLAERIVISGSVASRVLAELDASQREELRIMGEHRREKRRQHHEKMLEHHEKMLDSEG